MTNDNKKQTEQTTPAPATNAELQTAIHGCASMLLIAAVSRPDRRFTVEYDAPNHAISLVEYGIDGRPGYDSVDLAADPSYVLMTLHQLRQRVARHPQP